jgi:hypothetical protein
MQQPRLVTRHCGGRCHEYRAAVLVVAIAIGFLTAGCGSGAGSAIKSLAPSVSISVPSISPAARTTPTPTTQPSAPTTTAQPTTPTTTAQLTTPTTTAQPSAPTTTAQPSVTHTAVAPAATVQPTSSPTPGSGSGSSLTWLWVLIGAVAVIGVIVLVLIARHVGRRSVVAGGWLSKAIDAYAQGSALHDAMSIAARPEALAAEDSTARWADIQRRADDFAQMLYALREQAADADDRTRVTDVLATMQAVRSAMDAQRAPGGATADQAEVVRGRLVAFEQSLRELRPGDRRPR